MKYLVAIVVVLLMVIAFLAALAVRQNHSLLMTSPSPSSTTQAVHQAPTNPPTPTPTPSHIRVTSPTSRQIVSSTFTVTGKAQVFENQFNYVVVNASGKKIISGTITASGTPENGFVPFTKQIVLSPLPSDNEIVLELYDFSAKDGKKIDTVRIPLTYSK